jgi:tyrosyl-tRNA synthetase
MMENYFTLLTDLPAGKIAELIDGNKTHPKQAKVLLGKTIVTQFYSAATAELVANNFEKVFARKELPDEIPTVKMEIGDFSAAYIIANVFDVSSSEAKRMIKQGGVKIDGTKIEDPNEMITPKDGSIVQFGQRKIKKIEFELGSF